MSHLGKRLSALVDGELSGARRERALAHLARCEPCREEAVTLRILKQRMRGMGDTIADDALTGRLIALAAGQGQRSHAPWPLRGRGPQRTWRGARGKLIPSLVGGAVAVLAFAVPGAAFLLGGESAPGPKVTPAVDVFMVQHSVTGGTGPVLPADRQSPPAGGAAGPGWGAAGPGDSVAPGRRDRSHRAAPTAAATAATATAMASSHPVPTTGPRRLPSPALTPSLP